MNKLRPMREDKENQMNKIKKAKKFKLSKMILITVRIQYQLSMNLEKGGGTQIINLKNDF